MVNANSPVKYRYHLFREAFSTATDLDGLVVIEVKGKMATRYMHMYGKNPAWAEYLRTWGGGGYCTNQDRYNSKVARQRCTMHVYRLHAENHEGGCLSNVESQDL
jgi:hypothetical protein